MLTFIRKPRKDQNLNSIALVQHTVLGISIEMSGKMLWPLKIKHEYLITVQLI